MSLSNSQERFSFMIQNNLQLYNRFAHRLVDRSDIIYLYSIRLAGIDWGKDQRFALPLVSPDGKRAFTYEYKFRPALSSLLPRTGWNRREILFDLIEGRFQAGSWEAVFFDTPLEIKTSWTKINFFWKNPSSFTSPKIERIHDTIDSINEVGFDFKYRDNPVHMRWDQLQKVHFSKRAINTFEVPYLEAVVKTTATESYHICLPDEASHPFYQELIKHGYLNRNTLPSFLNSPEPVELTIVSKFGDIQIPSSDGFDFKNAESGIKLNGQLIAWEDLPLEPETLKHVQIGNMYFDQIEISEDYRFDSRFPAKSFFFNFSTVNGLSDLNKIKEIFRKWSTQSKGPCEVDFRPDWSTFFELKSPSFTMEISYSGSEGTGWIVLTNIFFRQCLLRKTKFISKFNPSKHYAFKSPETYVKDFYGIPSDQIFPCPDALNKNELYLWKDEHEQMALSHQGFLYIWKKSNLIDFVNEVSDEFGDRGGPYYESVLKFTDDGAIRLENHEPIEDARIFLGQKS